MMSARKWVPDHLVDDSHPELRASPNDWIIGPAGDCWLISGGDEDEMDAKDIEAERRHLQPGDTLDFLWYEDHGSFEALIQTDGTYEVRGFVPPAATHFAASGDPESLDLDLGSFCRNWAGNNSTDLPEWVTIHAYAWADVGIPHRLILTPEGARFEAVEAAKEAA